jgi:peptide/nickel transport system substrate-binding protein
MAEKAGYKGEPIRLLTSRNFEFHHTMMQVMAEQLRAAGFKPEMQVVDWATLVQRRGDSKVWDIYMTHSGQFPEPMLSPPQLGDGAPGWWDTPAKAKVLGEFNRQSDPNRRAALWCRTSMWVSSAACRRARPDCRDTRHRLGRSFGTPAWPDKRAG